VILCRRDGLRGAQVDAFDRACQGEGEPDAHPSVPHHRQHQAASLIERELAALLGVTWSAYDAAVTAVFTTPALHFLTSSRSRRGFRDKHKISHHTARPHRIPPSGNGAGSTAGAAVFVFVALPSFLYRKRARRRPKTFPPRLCGLPRKRRCKANSCRLRMPRRLARIPSSNGTRRGAKHRFVRPIRKQRSYCTRWLIP
jgi:hypothetical protein